MEYKIGIKNSYISANNYAYVIIMLFFSSAIVCTSFLMIIGANSYLYDVLFSLVLPLYLICLFLSYKNRKHELSIGTIYFFCFSFLLGIPACYLFIYNSSTPSFKGLMLCIILASMFIYFLGRSLRPTDRYSLRSFRLSNFFILVFTLVSLCQFYKIYVYYSFISGSGLGHLAIYLENEALVSSVPSIIRLISGFSVIMALMAVSFTRNKLIIAIAVLVLFSDIIIGIRGKAFSSVMALFIILLYVDIRKVSAFFAKLTHPIILGVLFVILSAVSYFREGYTIDFSSYLLVVLDSIASIISGMQHVFNISDFWYYSNFDSESVILQIFNLIGFDIREVTPISQTYTDIALGGHSTGIALSSSLPLESMVIGGPFGPLIMIIYPLAMILIIHKMLSSGDKLLMTIAISMLPGFVFSCRAELVLPFVYLIKAIPIIAISPVLIRSNI